MEEDAHTASASAVPAQPAPTLAHTMQKWSRLFLAENLSTHEASRRLCELDDSETAALEARLNVVDGLSADGSVATTAFVFRPIYNATQSSSESTRRLRHPLDASPRRLKVSAITSDIFMHARDLKIQSLCFQLCNGSSSRRSPNHTHRQAGHRTGIWPPAHRARPYFVPERSRTRSETVVGHPMGCMHIIDAESDATDASSTGAHTTMTTMTMMDTSGSESVSARTTLPRELSLPAPLIKARSLEDLCRGARAGGQEDGSPASHEMEFMSSRIQKLKFHD